MKLTRDSNPYNLKTKDGKGYSHEEIPIGYLTAEEFLNFLKKKIEFTRDDNLGRFCNNNSISMVKIKGTASMEQPHTHIKNLLKIKLKILKKIFKITTIHLWE